MPDFIDEAVAVDALFLEARIALHRESVAPIAGTGRCWECGTKLDDPRRRWCSALCRDLQEAGKGNRG